jgi:hypothetical protein
MQPYPYGPYPYAPYPYANGAPGPVRYMIPGGYGQNSPPFANQSFDRYAQMQTAPRPPQSMQRPLRYPPGYPQPGMPMNNSPRPQRPQQQSEQLQPPQPYYYNPYGANGGHPPSPTKTPAPKKGDKEFKEGAFTIAPDGAHSESIKGLVSNNDINDLLKHKGTKVKVSKIYRITKTKPDIKVDSSSDEDLPPIKPPQPQPQLQSRQQSVRRPSSSSSSGSHCSTCSNCSCSDCRHRGRSHSDDDCPECRAERSREQSRRHRRR